VGSLNPTLSWTDVGATAYRIELKEIFNTNCNGSSGSARWSSGDLPGTSAAVPAGNTLVANKSYVWRVRISTSPTWSAWACFRTVSTTVTPSPTSTATPAVTTTPTPTVTGTPPTATPTNTPSPTLTPSPTPTAAAGVPAPVAPNGPAPGQVVGSLNPTLSWTDVGATAYRIELKEIFNTNCNGSSGSARWSSGDLPGTSAAVPAGNTLVANRFYVWRVKVSTSPTWSAWACFKT
jgi:hypothetical protein